MKSIVILHAGVAALALIAVPAFAQTAESETSASGAQGGLQEIVVTAQRREENLQKVPISVSAISAGAIASRGITDTSLIQTSVPGLDMTRQTNGSTPFLRGVGTTNGAVGNEPSVATYVDNVYLGNGVASIFSFNNIERIEVLRGPQGTLFGRNASGGVINIITRDPTYETKLDASVGYSNYDTYDGAFYASGGLTDALSANIAAYGHKQNNGWGYNPVAQQDVFKGYDWGVRAKLKWEPTDRTTVLLAGDYNKSRSQQGMNFVLAPGAVGVDGTTVFRGRFTPQGGSTDRSIVKQYGTSLKIEHDLDFASLVSITAYRRFEGNFTLDQDSTPLPIVNADIDQSGKTFTQELQLLSPKGSALDWILGLYYYNDNSAYDPLRLLGISNIYGRQKTNSIAGYAQATYEILPDTNFTAGLRYTRDKRRVHGFITDPTGAVIPGTDARQSVTYEKLTWRLSLDHRFTPDITGYVSYNRGFKSGVYNLITFSAPPVRPEVLDAFEVGLKTDLLDRRLRFNISAFDYRYRDIQVQQIVAGSVISINAAKAHIYGGEIEFTALPTDNFKVSGGLSYLHGRYKRFPDGPYNVPNPGICDSNPGLPGNQPAQVGAPIGGNLQCAVDLSGKTTVHSPRFTANVAVDWRIPTSIGNFDLNANVYSNSGFYWEPDNNTRQKAYEVVNGSVQWTEPNEHYYVRGWVKNAFNTYYASYGFATTLVSAESPAPPRTYGVTLGYTF